jgi:hypothetical protein
VKIAAMLFPGKRRFRKIKRMLQKKEKSIVRVNFSALFKIEKLQYKRD